MRTYAKASEIAKTLNFPSSLQASWRVLKTGLRTQALATQAKLYTVPGHQRVSECKRRVSSLIDISVAKREKEIDWSFKWTKKEVNSWRLEDLLSGSFSMSWLNTKPNTFAHSLIVVDSGSSLRIPCRSFNHHGTSEKTCHAFCLLKAYLGHVLSKIASYIAATTARIKPQNISGLHSKGNWPGWSQMDVKLYIIHLCTRTLCKYW